MSQAILPTPGCDRRRWCPVATIIAKRKLVVWLPAGSCLAAWPQARKQAWVKTAVHCMNQIVASVRARKIAHRYQQTQQAFTRVRDASWRATFNCINCRGDQPSGTDVGSDLVPDCQDRRLRQKRSLSTDLCRRARTSPELLRRPLPSFACRPWPLRISTARDIEPAVHANRHDPRRCASPAWAIAP
jgi:hypothetical protein